MRTKSVKIHELYPWLHPIAGNPVIGITMGGDRLSCCDEAVVLEENGEIFGAATIAPHGEFGSDGMPTIVGIFVLPEHRRRGYGHALMRAAVERCRERGFPRVRVDVMSTGSKKAVEGLPADLRSMVTMIDMGTMFDRF